MSAHNSPEKRRHDVMSGYPPSPLISKRRRVSIIPASPGPNEQPPNLANGEALPDLFSNGSEPLYAFQHAEGESMEAKISTIKAADLGSLQLSLEAMDDETHRNRLNVRAKMTADKGTNDAYQRHLKNYEHFMLKDQTMRRLNNPLWRTIEAHPITATKVAAFLQHETTRLKVNTSHLPLPDYLDLTIILANIRWEKYNWNSFRARGH